MSCKFHNITYPRLSPASYSAANFPQCNDSVKEFQE